MSRARRSLKLEQWPALDRGLWARALKQVGPLGGASVAASWRPRTVKTVIEAYGYALEWLAKHDCLDPAAMPAARWTPDRLRRYIEDLQGRVRPATVLHRVLSLERALAALEARSDRRIFRLAITRLPSHADQTKKRARLQEPARLVELGFQLMAEAEGRRRKGARKNAALYRDGLQIALLAMRPLRQKNFSAIRIGINLVQRNDTWWLVFASCETKTSQPIDVPVPLDLVPAMERYLSWYRPLLAAGCYSGDRLWIGYRFQPQAPHSLQLSVVGRTQKAFGAPINPHLFRDCAATSIAIHDPENVRMAAIVLGHRSFGTTEKHYNLARTLEAGRSYADVIATHRTQRMPGAKSRDLCALFKRESARGFDRGSGAKRKASDSG